VPRTSDKADRILDYVNQFVQENGYAPSVREIGAAVGLRSTASVSYHIQALQDKGLLQSPGVKGMKRSIATGIRPGQKTSEYISKIISRITLIGALFLSVIAILPIILAAVTGTNIGMSGTSILIMVGVALETVQAIESQMLMRHYKGFLE